MTTDLSVAVSKKVIAALFQLTTESSWKSSPETEPEYIALDKVSFEEWQPSRTERCLKMMADGKEQHPIDVVGFKLNDKHIYDVSDGNHRSRAREIKKYDTVLANVAGYYSVTTDDKIIYRNQVWQKSGTDMICLSLDYLDDWLLDELRKLGVQEFLPST